MPESDAIPMGFDSHEMSRRLSLEGFLVDFFGGVVPGVIFIISSALALFLPIAALAETLNTGQVPSFFEMMKSLSASLRDTPSAMWLVLFTLLAIVSYFVGHIFYRKDPKDANKASYLRIRDEHFKAAKTIPENATTGRPIKTEDQWSQENLASGTVLDCEFPYPTYDKYLRERGLVHLLNLVVWCKDEFKRSKTFVNILKERLHYYMPERCGTIIRNEAHVRLASSTWYACGILNVICGWGAFLCLAALGAGLIQGWSLNWPQVIGRMIPFLT